MEPEQSMANTISIGGRLETAERPADPAAKTGVATALTVIENAKAIALILNCGIMIRLLTGGSLILFHAAALWKYVEFARLLTGVRGNFRIHTVPLSYNELRYKKP